jgi:hypothetical protein
MIVSPCTSRINVKIIYQNIPKDSEDDVDEDTDDYDYDDEDRRGNYIYSLLAN